MPNCKCLDCFKCKTRKFKSADALIEWCKERECTLNKRWIDAFLVKKEVRLFWCIKKPRNPRMVLNTSTLLFVPSCKEKVHTQRRKSKICWVTNYQYYNGESYALKPETRSNALKSAKRLASMFLTWVCHYRDSEKIIFDSRK